MFEKDKQKNYSISGKLNKDKLFKKFIKNIV